MVTSVFAMKAAIAKARACGIGYAGVFNSCHFGAAGYYAAMAADEDMIGVAMANDTPSVTAPGAIGRVTGSNPLAYAVPTGAGPPILLDMATSTVAGGKVAAASRWARRSPMAGSSASTAGRPRIRPRSSAGGALTPMAGHKGYGLALLIECLSAVLTGAAITQQVGTWAVGDPSVSTGHGAAFIAVNIGSMMPIDEFKRRVERNGGGDPAGPSGRRGGPDLSARRDGVGAAAEGPGGRDRLAGGCSGAPWPGWRGIWASFRNSCEAGGTIAWHGSISPVQ